MNEELKLQLIKKQFLTARNIQEKRKLTPILQKIQTYGYNFEITQNTLGEDSAIIPEKRYSTEELQTLHLLTTDALLPSFVRKSPFGAGFSSIYVGIDDIIACGGTPSACSIIISFPTQEIGEQIIQGIIKGTQVFQIPLIRGHTTTDANDVFLASTVVGTCPSNGYISSKTAHLGDFIALVWDKDGKQGKANHMYWDTITNKKGKEFYEKRQFFPRLARKGYIHASKDVSNGGILGTLYQMMQYSKHKGGATIQLDELNQFLKKISMPYSLEDFLFVFLTSAFLICGDPADIPHISNEISACNMEFTIVGKVIENPLLQIEFQEESTTLIKLGADN